MERNFILCGLDQYVLWPTYLNFRDVINETTECRLMAQSNYAKRSITPHQSKSKIFLETIRPNSSASKNGRCIRRIGIH